MLKIFSCTRMLAAATFLVLIHFYFKIKGCSFLKLLVLRH